MTIEDLIAAIEVAFDAPIPGGLKDRIERDFYYIAYAEGFTDASNVVRATLADAIDGLRR